MEYVELDGIQFNSQMMQMLLIEGALAEYLDNIWSLKGAGREYVEPIEDIDSSFTWSNTPEDHDFWEDLNNKDLDDFDYVTIDSISRYLQFYGRLDLLEGRLPHGLTSSEIDKLRTKEII